MLRVKLKKTGEIIMCMEKYKTVEEKKVKEKVKDIYLIPGTQYTVDMAVKLVNENICSSVCNLVFRTKDYSRFAHFEENRERRKHNLKRLEESIDSFGYIVNNPIIVTYRKGILIILDGAHRFEILKKKIIEGKDFEISYIIIDTDDILKTAQILNLAKSNWIPVDFVSSFTKSNQNYANFKKYLWDNEKYADVPFWSKIAILTKCYANSGNGNSKKLAKNGLMEFPIDQLQNVYSKADRAQEVAKTCKSLGAHTKLDRFVNAVIWLSEYGNGFCYSRFVANLNVYGKELLMYDRGNFEKNMSIAIKIHNKGDNQSKLRAKNFYKEFELANKELQMQCEKRLNEFHRREKENRSNLKEIC